MIKAGIDYRARNTGGFFVDITPDRDAIARYGLTMREVQDVIETAIGGMPIEVTIEGRNRFTINVRFPRELRQDIEQLKQIEVPLPGRAQGSANEMFGMSSSAFSLESPLLASTDPSFDYMILSSGQLYTQMDNMGGSSGSAKQSPTMPSSSTGAKMTGTSLPTSGSGTVFSFPEGRPSVPLGQIADIKITGGPPMIRDENGMLVGYVYVDIDQKQRDIGGYVSEAKRIVGQEITLPKSYHLKWTGQYELIEAMASRMRVVVPVTLMLVVILLNLNFRNLTETQIVLASVPFALVGSIWLMYFLGYNYSTATLVGIIALVGLATQTGIVMVLYLDHAYERRKQAGMVRDLNDIIWAHMEGTVMRVRPKLMTVGTTMIGLVPLLWATGAGSDVMKRIAAPMVGGLISSTFLTLEIIPVIYTYWRLWQIKHDNKADRATTKA